MNERTRTDASLLPPCACSFLSSLPNEIDSTRISSPLTDPSSLSRLSSINSLATNDPELRVVVKPPFPSSLLLPFAFLYDSTVSLFLPFLFPSFFPLHFPRFSLDTSLSLPSSLAYSLYILTSLVSFCFPFLLSFLPPPRDDVTFS